MEIKDKIKDLRINRFSDPLPKSTITDTLELKHVQLYMKYEEGITKPAVSLLDKISSYYKISADYFFDSKIGKTFFHAPYFKDYNAKKERILYEELEDKFTELIVNKDYFATDFFLFEIPNESLEDEPFGLMIIDNDLLTVDYETMLKKENKGKNFVPNGNIAKISEPDELTKFSILMQKANLSDVLKMQYPTVYLILDKISNKPFLATINRFYDNILIIPIYDAKEKHFLKIPTALGVTKEHKYKGISEYELYKKSLSIDDVKIIAKAMSMYDPNDHFNF